jgi:hypothetical protein
MRWHFWNKATKAFLWEIPSPAIGLGPMKRKIFLIILKFILDRAQDLCDNTLHYDK